MIDLEQLKLALRLKYVDRFQADYLPNKEKVDQHSFRAAALYSYLGGTELEAMLFHDIEESITGDIPSPVKKNLTGLEKYEKLRPSFKDPKEKKLGKLCDKLELVLNIQEIKIFYGNIGSQLEEIYDEEWDQVKSLAEDLENIGEVRKIMRMHKKLI